MFCRQRVQVYYTKTKKTKTKNWGNKKQPNEYQNRLNGVDYVLEYNCCMAELSVRFISARLGIIKHVCS